MALEPPPTQAAMEFGSLPGDEDLLPRLGPDDGLKLPHHQGVGMGPATVPIR